MLAECSRGATATAAAGQLEPNTCSLLVRPGRNGVASGVNLVAVFPTPFAGHNAQIEIASPRTSPQGRLPQRLAASRLP